MASAYSALAATLGMTTAELSEYRYQATRERRAVYALSERYYCVGKKAPKDGRPWQKHPDQFWAERAGTVVWFADVEANA